ncbi:purple acid phosphatase 15 [Tanacetum coccineum]
MLLGKILYITGNPVKEFLLTVESSPDHSQLYLYVDLQNYTSDIIHHVQLKGLSPDTIYYYRCGDPSIKAMSDVFTFKAMPISGPKSYPKIGIVGDLGLVINGESLDQEPT